MLDILFGEGYELTHKKDLSQPGQFATNERIQVIGPKGSFPSVSILGPVRPETQVELSATDARSIGLKPPVRESGDLKGSEGCKIVGPKGEVELRTALSLQNATSMPHRLTLSNTAYRISRLYPLRWNPMGVP